MRSKEALESNLGAMQETIAQLRDIRRAVTIPQGRPLTNLILPRRYASSSVDRQVLLSEAKIIAGACGDYVSAAITEGSDKQTLRERWIDVLSEAIGTYRRTEQLSANKVHLRESSYWVFDHALNLMINPSFLAWDMLVHNNMGVEDLKKLIERKIGVIAPLSSDFLIASIFRSYLKRTEGETFNLYSMAVAVGEGRTVVHYAAADSPELSFYLDKAYVGSTGEAAYEALKDVFPNKVIHVPNKTRVKDVPSDVEWKSLPRGIQRKNLKPRNYNI